MKTYRLHTAWKRIVSVVSPAFLLRYHYLRSPKTITKTTSWKLDSWETILSFSCFFGGQVCLISRDVFRSSQLLWNFGGWCSGNLIRELHSRHSGVEVIFHHFTSTMIVIFPSPKQTTQAGATPKSLPGNRRNAKVQKKQRPTKGNLSNFTKKANISNKKHQNKGNTNNNNQLQGCLDN